ncbi:hypothetical protein [Mycobacterium dioxanotrophicus]|uniref:hypothetical protein n=1 Tax=Mycobacterium dioxanotrophicus TaxID=482462 RepID=UPI001E6093C7|nr:hypothetical protein [Mycobacterium dioxanotrophicus]
MAAPDLRVVRRRKGTALVASGARPVALTAASAPVSDPSKVFGSATMGRRNNWQAEAWEMYRAVGELGYYVRWRANSCSRVRLVASEIDPDTGLPTGSIDPDNAEGMRFAEIVREIAGGPLGQAKIIKRAAECLTVPGEHWIAILVRPAAGWADGSLLPERWFVVSRKEIEKGARRNSVVIKLPDGSKHEFDAAAGDGMFRVWNQDAEDASEPTSPVQACLDPLREIVRTTKKIRNADNSRLLNNGLLFVPSEASLPDSQAPVSADKPAGSPTSPARRQGVAEKVQHMIVRVGETAAKDPDSMAALVPVVVAAPGEHLSKIHHQEIGKDVTDIALKTRTEAIARLAMGLDMSPEQLLGLGNSNHWSAWLMSDNDVQLHVSPVLETICQAIYDSVLRHMLVAAGIDPDKYVLWYDASRLTADPDKTDEARDAFDRGAITAEALVRQYGLPDDALYDFTSLDGWKQWAQDKVSQDPTLLPTLLPLLDASVQAIDFPEPQPALPPPADNQQSDDESGADGQQEPATEDNSGDQAAGLRGDVELAVVDLLVGRALELAGKRRVRTNDRVQHARLRDVATRDYHRFMPPVDDGEVGRLIKGFDDVLDGDFAAAHGLDPERVRAAVRRIARRELTAQVVDGQVV